MFYLVEVGHWVVEGVVFGSRTGWFSVIITLLLGGIRRNSRTGIFLVRLGSRLAARI